MIANSSQEIFIAKYDQSGDLLWARQAGGITGEASYDISRDSEGNILLAGYFHEFSFFGDTISGDLSDSLISRGNLDIFIAKFNVDGDLIWVTQAGGTENDIVFSVITGEDNSVFLTGSFSGVISFGDTISGNQQIDLTSIGNADFFVAKYDKTGEIEWVKQAGGVFTYSVPNYVSFCTGYSLCSDNMDNIYVT